MIKVVSSQQMREMDRHTIEDLGIPGVVLMENAGVGVFRVIEELLNEVENPLVYVFSGKGNNGGDGYVVARHLWDSGVAVEVFVTGTKSDLKGDALINFQVLEKLPVPVTFLKDAADLKFLRDQPPDLVVDALLGTGIQGAVRGFTQTVIQELNQLGVPIVAIDVPSGINADNPLVAGNAIQADVTVTMALPKICHVFYPAKSYTGTLYIADIGIPHTTRQNREVHLQMVEGADIFLPPRSEDAHKYTVGKVGVLAGSPGYTGAAALASEAALKIGAGLVILGVPEQLNPILESNLTEVITRPYPAAGAGHLSVHSLENLQELLDWCDVLAIGPGLGREKTTIEAVQQILGSFSKPLVIDADALFAAALNVGQVFEKAGPHWILTPHHGEFLRFLPDIGKQDLRANPTHFAREFAMEKQVTLLLKGAPSLVATADSQVFINPTGNAGLASGGSGDVLTGFVAGLLAQGLPPAEAAYTANYLHGLCADEIVEKSSEYSLLAGELIRQLDKVLHHFTHQHDEHE